MRILALSDLHNSRRGAETAERLAQEVRPDLIAIAGDFTNLGPDGYARDVLGRMPVTTLAVPGNMDAGAVGPALSSGMGRNLHLRREVVGGLPFVGLGGWINHPSLSESWGVRPDEAERALSGLMTEGCVLLTHVPPLGHLDGVPVPEAFAPAGDRRSPRRRGPESIAPVLSAAGSMEHIGSRMVLGLVERFRPRLVISGHVHEARGIEEAGATVFVNPGPAKNGFGAEILVGERVKARLIV